MIEQCVDVVKKHFPEPWEVWATEHGLLTSFQAIAVKGTIDGELYGFALQYSGRRATAWEWGWNWEPDDWGDLREWPDDAGQPPDRDGYDGERVHGEHTATRCWDWVWKKRGTHFKEFEVAPEQMGKIAKEQACAMREQGLKW